MIQTESPARSESGHRGRYRISAATVMEIRRRFHSESAPAIAESVGCSHSSAWAIATGRTRLDVPMIDLGARTPPSTTLRGEASPRAKLTTSQVLEIRRRHRAGDDPAELASAFGVTRTCIQLIAARRRWRHI
jgi:hypothetical protein